MTFLKLFIVLDVYTTTQAIAIKIFNLDHYFYFVRKSRGGAVKKITKLSFASCHNSGKGV